MPITVANSREAYQTKSHAQKIFISGLWLHYVDRYGSLRRSLYIWSSIPVIICTNFANPIVVGQWNRMGVSVRARRAVNVVLDWRVKAEIQRRSSEAGSAIMFLFVAVALFGALSFAFLQGSRGNLSMMTKEAEKAAATRSQDCANAVNMATKRLTARGCGELTSYDPDGYNVNPGAPTDGSCSVFHPSGGGVKVCGNYDPSCMLDLQIGESCNGAVYAGVAGGNRIYAAPTDAGSMTWNNGTSAWTGNLPAAGSVSDGFSNTNALVALVNAAAPYVAAQTCRALGPKWYLPAPDELQLLYDSRNVGDFSGTFTTAGFVASIYWASRYHTSTNAYFLQFSSGGISYDNRTNSYRVRCVRRY